MRVTNRMMNDNIMRNLHDGLDRLSKLNQQLSTGKAISMPHDDPVAIRKSLGLNSNLNEIEQYKRNVNQGLSFLDTTETAVSQVVEALHKVKELAVKGSNGTLGSDDMDKIKTEVDQVFEHIMSLSNTQYDGKYVFSGTKTDTQPYDATYTFQGNAGSINYEIAKGVQVPINLNGQAFFDQIITAVQSLSTNLGSGDQVAIDADLGAVDDAIENTLNIQAKVGAVTNRLDLAKTRLDDENLNLTKLLSENEDADIAEVVMNLNMQEAVYRTALGSAARIIQPSLIDFLR